MHEVAIRREIIERVLARRGRLHLFDRLDAKRTARATSSPASTASRPSCGGAAFL